jgi:hypothetical protein
MNGLTLREGAVNLLLEEVETFGAVPAETGAFLLAREDNIDELSVVAVPGGEGVSRRRNLFAVSAEAISRLFDVATQRGLVIRAQLHSHRRGAFLSPTDLEHGFNVEGFVTCVVPTYASPPREPARWSWWRFETGTWVRHPAPSILPGVCERIDVTAEAKNGR